MGDLSVLTIPMGTKPAGTAGAPVTADAIMSTPDGEALLIANPADDTVYFFTEGSQSALGGFQGHTLQPRAVQVVDRSLKEPAPGVYTGSVRLPQDGSLVVALLLDEPSLTHCFTFTARPSDDSLDLEAPSVDIDVLAGAAAVAGSEHRLRFELRNVDDGAVVSGLGDILAMVIQASGNWSARVVATADAQGTYTAAFTPPAVGLYSVIFSVPSQGLSFQNVPPVNIQVAAP